MFALADYIVFRPNESEGVLKGVAEVFAHYEKLWENFHKNNFQIIIYVATYVYVQLALNL